MGKIGTGSAVATVRELEVRKLRDNLDSNTAVANALGISEAAVRQALQRFHWKQLGGVNPYNARRRTRLTGTMPAPANDIAPAAANDDGPPVPVFRARSAPAPVQIAPGDTVQRFFLSYAQNETIVHEGFLANLEAYAAWCGDSRLMVSRGNYDKQSFGTRGAKRSANDNETASDIHPSLLPYIVEGAINIGDRLVFCAQMNTLPTAVSPLSGFKAYTGSRWGVFPHPAVAQESVATHPGLPAKQMLSTGSMTRPNYVQKKAGIKAEFNHEIGCVIVELAPDGEVWCRHILAAPDGSFQDLDRVVRGGQVSIGNRVGAAVWGDIHHTKIDPVVALSVWGYDVATGRSTGELSLVDYLAPKHQVYHDLIDFATRNHHNVSDPHFLFRTHLQGTDDVRNEMKAAGDFLRETSRPWCEGVVVQSNHDNAYTKWLTNPAYNYRSDPVNAEYFLESNLRMYQAIRAGTERTFFEDSLRDLAAFGPIRFTGENDSFVPIRHQFSMHGHQGADGGKGSLIAFDQMGCQSIVGHGHKAGRRGGAIMVGTFSQMDMGYNRGPSSWSHTCAVEYLNGKATLMTMSADGRWFA